MTENVKKYIESYKSGFREFEQNLNGQTTSEIHKIRKNAFEVFFANGFPTPKIEEWKYTNVEPIAKMDFKMEVAETSLRISDIQKYFIKNLDCFKIVFINGKYNKSLSDNTNSETDFTIVDLDQFLNVNMNESEAFLSNLADFKDDSFVALNTAFMKNGIVIRIKKNKIISKPFYLLFLSTEENENHLNQPRILIDAETNSQAQIIENSQSLNPDNAYFSNIVSEFHIAENAKIEHIKIQNQAENSFHVSNLFSKIAKDSYFKTLNINIGGKITRNNIYSYLNGHGSETVLNGIYIGNGSQHIDNNTVIEHKKPNCLSTEIFKGIIGDKARGVFNGKIHVYPEAQKTNAIQNNSGLLLSDDANIDTKPQLEIYADDVRCTHGATIGQIDKEALFYLRSRGIDEQLAKKMLINAFAGEVVDDIENETLRNGIQQYINDKLKLVT